MKMLCRFPDVLAFCLILPAGASLRAETPDPAPPPAPTKKNESPRLVVNCEKVAEQVKREVQKHPEKVLPIMENSLITHESCACEILRSAILASKADKDLREQLRIAAIDLVPTQRQIIVDCFSRLEHLTVTDPAGASSGGSDTDGGSDYVLPTDLRGVYFIEPMNVAGGTTATTKETTKLVNDTRTKIVTQVIRDSAPPPHRPSPISPSTGGP